MNGQGAKRRRPQAAVADLVPLATRVALRGGIFGGLFEAGCGASSLALRSRSLICANGILSIRSNFPLQIWTDHAFHASPIRVGLVSMSSRANVAAYSS